MSNSRLLQMYGFTEEKNPYDDVYLPDDIIKAAIEKHEVEAKDAKIKLLDSLGFFSEGELKSKSQSGRCTQNVWEPWTKCNSLMFTRSKQMFRFKKVLFEFQSKEAIR